MKKKTNGDFIDELKKLNPTILPLESYVNSSIKIEFKCQVCGEHWFATPSKVLSGRGCPKCTVIKRTNSIKYSILEIKEKLKEKNPRIELVGPYINSKTKVKAHCLDCDNIWQVVPTSQCISYHIN